MQSLVQLAQALADETRLRLLYLLLDGEATVNDLVTRLDIAQPRVSTHLALLRQAGLVSVAIKGRQRVYRVDAAPVRAALEAAYRGLERISFDGMHFRKDIGGGI